MYCVAILSVIPNNILFQQILQPLPLRSTVVEIMKTLAHYDHISHMEFKGMGPIDIALGES